MTRRILRVSTRTWRNALAVMLATGGLVAVQLSFEPAPVGTPQSTGAARRMRGRAAGANVREPLTAPLSEPVAAPAPPRVVRDDGTEVSLPQGREVVEGQAALRLNLEMLEAGCRMLSRIPDYTATFFRQERIGGQLSELQVIDLKLRQEPFSVYLKWLAGDPGREVIYVAGENENKMLLHFGGWKSKMLPAMFLTPDSPLALHESRYPITKVGILALAEMLIDDRREDLRENRLLHCRMVDGDDERNRDCYRFTLEYASPTESRLYRKSVQFIDKRWWVPIAIRNYTWPAHAAPANDDDATLIEYYAYEDIRLNRRLADVDFDHTNANYAFRD